ncbi:MAG: YitT family protein [Lachnospiraceae bacterium]
MRFLSGKEKLRGYLFVVTGTMLMAFGIKNFYDSSGLVTGGFTGVSIIIKGMSESYLGYGIPLWFTNLILNIPLFIVAGSKRGLRFLKKSIFGAAMLSGWLAVIPQMDMVQQDLLLSSVYGGLLNGAGLGLVLLSDATTGGVDLLGTLLHNKWRHYSIVQIMQVIDAAIIIVGASVFGMHKALYAILAVFITTRISDFVIEGWKFSKVVYIISNEHEKIAEAIMRELKRGVTALEARGLYSQEEKRMLYCVVSKKELIHLKDIIRAVDEDAFVIVSEAREVLGEGFSENH